MDQRLQRRFRIGMFEVEPLAGRIAGPSGSQHLQPKVMDVLVYLAQHPGEIVERDTLLEQVWRRVTSEEVLTRCISELRRALGDDRGSPSYIQTVPKRGYRLVEPVVPAMDDVAESGAADRAQPGAGTASSTSPPREEWPRPNAPSPAAAPPLPAAPSLTATPPLPDALPRLAAPSVPDAPPLPAAAMASVAILPFDNHSADPSYVYVGDAFAAELHSTLARVDRLRVASRRSSFLFKDANVDVREIGRKLSVDYVITGSLQCSGPSLHVVAELADAGSGTQVWARSYDRNSEDLLAIEKEIAEEIVGSFTTQQLRAEIRNVRHQSTSSLDAWGLVQKARSFVLDYTAEGLAEAIEPLHRAIELDRDYPAAHATLSSVLVERLVNGFSSEPERDEADAIAAAAKALSLAPQDPFILKMASLIWSYCGDHRKALGCLRKAVAYAPFDFGAWGYMGWPLTATGEAQDLDDLRRILERLLKMEAQHPGVAFWLYHRSVADVCEGRYDSAADSAEAAVELRPNLALAWMHYANVLGHRKDKSGARAAVEHCRSINAAMTPRHFESLINRMCTNKDLVERRVGGLRLAAGALRR